MGVPVLIIGASGSGKSTSLRNFTEDEVGLFNVSGKPLPFRGGMKFARLSDAAKIRAVLAKGSRRCYVIDDAQYIMRSATASSASSAASSTCRETPSSTSSCTARSATTGG